MRRHSPAFTIVELLIVVVIIAILAAITVVTYTGIQTRARASAASSALSQAVKKLELYKVDNSAYPTSTNLASAGITNSNDTTYQYTSDGTTYCLTATNVTISYYLNSTTTPTPTAGGCPGHGVGGNSAITNLAYNPSGMVNATGWSAWGGSSGGTISVSAVDAAWAAHGRAVRSTWTTANTNYTGDLGWQVPTTGYTLAPNTQYTASWKVQTSKSQRLNPAVGNWGISGGGSGSGTGIANSSSGVVVVSSLTPVTQWITFTTGSNTIFCKIFSTLTSGTGASYWNVGDYIEVSDFMLVQGSTQYTFADGNSPNWVWNGTANASTSTGPAL